MVTMSTLVRLGRASFKNCASPCRQARLSTSMRAIGDSSRYVFQVCSHRLWNGCPGRAGWLGLQSGIGAPQCASSSCVVGVCCDCSLVFLPTPLLFGWFGACFGRGSSQQGARMAQRWQRFGAGLFCQPEAPRNAGQTSFLRHVSGRGVTKRWRGKLALCVFSLPPLSCMCLERWPLLLALPGY